MFHLSQAFCWFLLVSSVVSIPYSHLKQLREQKNGIERNDDDPDRLFQVDKALFIKETAISLLLEVKLFPFWNLVPDGDGDGEDISTAPHRRTYDNEEEQVEEEGEPGVGVVGAGFDVDFPGGYGIGYILENPIKFGSESENSIEK